MTAATDRQAQIQSFVVRYLRSSGAEVQWQEDGNLAVALPPALAASLESAANLLLCFQPDHPAPAEFLTFGHPLLDRMLTLAGQRGLATSLLFTSGLDSDFMHLVMTTDPWSDPAVAAPSAYRRLVNTMRRVRFGNAHSRLRQRRMVHQLQVLFLFRVSLVSDEKREYIAPVLIDPVTEAVDTMVNAHDAVAFALPGRMPQEKEQTAQKPVSAPATGRGSAEPMDLSRLSSAAAEYLPGDHYAIFRLYRKACAHLESTSTDLLAAFASEAEERLAHELARIEEYYKGLTNEVLDPLRKVFRRMASLSVRSQLARSYESQYRYAAQLHNMKAEAADLEAQYEEELHKLAEEKERRRNELAAKYQAHAELHLINIAALRVPRVEYTYRLSSQTRREITFTYDVLRDRLVDLACEACGRALHEALLCSCGDLVCTDCAGICSCGKPVCSTCAAGTCHVCGGLLCPVCASTGCAIAAVQHLGLQVCANCRNAVCSQCLRMAGEQIVPEVDA